MAQASVAYCQCGLRYYSCTLCDSQQCGNCNGMERSICCTGSSCSNLIFDKHIHVNLPTILLCKMCVSRGQYSKPTKSNCVRTQYGECGLLCTDCADKDLLKCKHCDQMGCKRLNHYQTDLQACLECYFYCANCREATLKKHSWKCSERSSVSCRYPFLFCGECVTEQQIANCCADSECDTNRTICRYCRPTLAKSECTDCQCRLYNTIVSFSKTLYVEQVTQLLQTHLPAECPLGLRALILNYANIFHPESHMQDFHTAFSVSNIPGFPQTTSQKEPIDNSNLASNIWKPKTHASLKNSTLFDDSTAHHFVLR